MSREHLWRWAVRVDEPVWALLLVGDFGPRGYRHTLPALDEPTAHRRAEWWRRWRDDVQVAVVVRDRQEQAWHYVEEGVIA